MTSTHFFRKSLFHFEDEPPPDTLPDRHVLTPWNSHEVPPIVASKRSPRSPDTLKPIPEKQPTPVPQIQKQPEAPRKVSNLLPEKKSVIRESQLLPVLPKVEPVVKKLKSQLKLKGIPIKQFLSQRREQRELEQMLHKRSIALINQSLESSFLARRNLKKRSSFGYSNTIDLHRELLQPMQIYRSQQVVQITPDKFIRRGQISSLSKYLPIKSERYQL